MATPLEAFLLSCKSVSSGFEKSFIFLTLNKNKMRDFKRLIVWQKGFQLFIDSHKFCRKLPPEEKYELASQLRRAAFSIPANIAEGSAKATNAHKKLFLENSLGSSYEVETALLSIIELYPVFKPDCEQSLNICIEVQKMLIALINKLT